MEICVSFGKDLWVMALLKLRLIKPHNQSFDVIKIISWCKIVI